MIEHSNGTSTAYAYNQQRGWPTGITHRLGSVPFAAYGLTYDNGSNTVGNLTGVAETVGGASSTVTYGYDALYRLTAEQRTGTAPGGHTFGYDLAGNRTLADGNTFTYAAANKIISSGFTYDGDGNLTGDSSATYAWDDRSNLVSRTAGGVTTTYGYDAQGLRVVSQVNGGAKTFYVFAGDTLIGEVNSSGVVQAAYTWGAAGLVSEWLVPSSKSLWYHFGPQGETRQLTDGTGSVVDAYVYSAYGQPIATAGTDANSFRYGGAYGYYTDNSAGQALCTHRWYDPNTARWLSRDPIGYDGGDNLYRYCGNAPTNHSDPSGYYEDDNYREGFGFPVPGVAVVGPRGQNIWNNIREAERERDRIREIGLSLAKSGPVGILSTFLMVRMSSMPYSWYVDQVAPGHRWDFKVYPVPTQSDRPPGAKRGSYLYDNYGNFNAGAVAAALGISKATAINGADVSHGLAHPLHPRPRKDDHGDEWIAKGYDWYMKSGCK